MLSETHFKTFNNASVRVVILITAQKTNPQWRIQQRVDQITLTTKAFDLYFKIHLNQILSSSKITDKRKYIIHYYNRPYLKVDNLIK